MKNALIPLTFFLVLSSATALAEDEAPRADARAACKADVDKLCPGIQPGSGRIVGCLKQNEAQMSAACKEAMAKARERRAPVAPASPQG